MKCFYIAIEVITHQLKVGSVSKYVLRCTFPDAMLLGLTMKIAVSC